MYSLPMYFFTSDTHYYHANIIKYCDRPFADVPQMNMAMIDRWNQVVTPDSTVFHLGDFAFSSYEKAREVLSFLNGRKVLVMGNHDRHLKKFTWNKLDGAADLVIKDRHELDFTLPNGKVQRVVMCHYPLEPKGDEWVLHGHEHGGKQPPRMTKVLDVGVDCHDFYPISLERVAEIMQGRFS